MIKLAPPIIEDKATSEFLHKVSAELAKPTVKGISPDNLTIPATYDQATIKQLSAKLDELIKYLNSN